VPDPGEEDAMALGTARPLALAALTALAACGGSGGGGGAPVVVVVGNEDFVGTYFAVLKAGREAGGPDARGATGTLTADGAGNASHTQTINDSGVVTGPTTTLYDFAVAADGSLELSLAGTVFARGGIPAHGDVALLASAAPGAFPGLIVLARRRGLHDETSLAGTYHFVELLFGSLGGASVAFTGTTTFDGLGGASTTSTGNSMGLVASGITGSATYTVIGDGTSTYTPAALGPPTQEGGVVAGGAVALWGGSTNDGQSPVVTVVIRESTGAGLATLEGAYWLVLLERDAGTGEFRSLHGTATADGAGALTLLATSNVEGVLAPEPLQTTTYTVSPIGRLTVDAGGSALVGGVSQDGSFAALGGGTAPGSNPTLAILARK
jgi:hypothetical protein